MHGEKTILITEELFFKIIQNAGHIKEIIELLSPAESPVDCGLRLNNQVLKKKSDRNRDGAIWR